MKMSSQKSILDAINYITHSHIFGSNACVWPARFWSLCKAHKTKSPSQTLVSARVRRSAFIYSPQCVLLAKGSRFRHHPPKASKQQKPHTTPGRFVLFGPGFTFLETKEASTVLFFLPFWLSLHRY